MASTLVDLVKITSNSTGTGAITLGASVAGYRGHEALTNGEIYSYSIQDGDAWEFGRGTFMSATGQFIRTPIDSSDGGAAISLRQNAQIAFVALSEDLDAVQLSNNAVAAAEQVAIDAAQVAADRIIVEAGSKSVVNGEAVYPHAYATTVPQGVASISNDGIATGSGGTPGTYAGGVSGGPVGFSWEYAIGLDGKIASYEITSPGISTATDAPILSFPSGSVTGAVVPTATVSARIAEASGYWVISSDGATLDLFSNVAGVASPVLDPTGDQVKVFVSAGAEKVAETAQAWAESPTAPDPTDPDSKSAKTWAASLGESSEVIGLVRGLAAPAPQKDDYIVPPVPFSFDPALAFAEAESKKARAFIHPDGGLAGKGYTFVFGKAGKDDYAGHVRFGLLLDDGKMPLQFDDDFHVYFKPQSRLIDVIREELGGLPEVTWRGPAGATDVVSTGTQVHATFEDTTVTPNWRGTIGLPVAGASTAAYVTQRGTLELFHMHSQSNGITSGVDNPTIYPSARFPYQAFCFTVGRLASIDGTTGDAILVNEATLNDIMPVSDISGYASMPMTIAANLESYRSRRMGEAPRMILVRSDSQGGIPITKLRKGGTASGWYYYDNARTTRRAAKTMAAQRNLQLVVHSTFIQGEDNSVATDQYLTYFIDDVIEAHLADCVLDTGRELSSFVFLQTNGTSDGSGSSIGAGQNAALAHLQAARLYEGRRVAFAGPMYAYPFSADIIHASERGRNMHTDMCNYVRRQVMRHGAHRHLDIARRGNNVPALGINQRIFSNGLMANTRITALGTGTGGTGTYTLNNTFSAAVASRRMTAFGAVFEGSISGNVLTVTKIYRGALDVTISGSDVKIRTTHPICADRGWIPDVGSALGWEWSDTGSSRTISSVDVEGDLITLHLNGAPSGAFTLGYAFNTLSAPYLQSGLANDLNWAGQRGVIYHDTGERSDAYSLPQKYGYPALRMWMPRLREEW